MAQRSPAGAERLGGDQDAFGVQAVEQVAEALALLANPVAGLDVQTVVGDLAGGDGVAPELGNGADGHRGILERGDEERQAVGTLCAFPDRGGTGQQQDTLGFQRLGRPDLAPGDPVARPIGDGAGADGGGVQAGVRLGHAERDVQVPGRDAGQVTLLELFGAVPDHRVHAEDRQVNAARPVHARAGGSHLLQHDRGLGDASPATAVRGRDGDADPAALGHRGVELPGERVGLVEFGPVLVGEPGADLTNRLADEPVIRVLGEVHAILRRSVINGSASLIQYQILDQ